MLWIVCHCSTILIRKNASKQAPQGTDWIVLKNHGDPMNFLQITVNESMAFALDLQGQVYMRMGMCKKFPEGNKWLKVLKNLRYISLSLSSQVSFFLNY